MAGRGLAGNEGAGKAVIGYWLLAIGFVSKGQAFGQKANSQGLIAAPVTGNQI
jgi:hypothetical protein